MIYAIECLTLPKDTVKAKIRKEIFKSFLWIIWNFQGLLAFFRFFKHIYM